MGLVFFSESPAILSQELGALVADRAMRHGAMLSDKKPALPHALETPASPLAPLQPNQVLPFPRMAGGLFAVGDTNGAASASAAVVS